MENREQNIYKLEVDFEDLISYNKNIADKLRLEPRTTIPLLEEGIKNFFQEQEKKSDSDEVSGEREEIPNFQFILNTMEKQKNLRDLNSETVSQLVVISGIIISASKSSIKMKTCHLQCRACGQEKDINVPNGFGGLKIPRICESSKSQKGGQKCPMDSYMIIQEKSKFIDVQILKLQEAPELIPVGEIPRSYLLYAERNLVNIVTPGTRVTVVGIQCVDERINSETADSPIYIRVIQFIKDTAKTGRQTFHFTHSEEVEFKNFAKTHKIYDKITRSIAPAIYGSEDIKKAIACLLFGGCRKRMSGGVNLRGDINILLLGDPSTAKSQFLKFAERVAPIAVYTSGKGSSAAGLTASILRDPNSGEFQLEGGAMVLADGGIVCIDEFDKMSTHDRVAIHEAMEQQTISVAKAGITTTLNSRTSVLAAANPIYGHLSDLKTMQEQIDFQTTILSRFDCIFIVRDMYNQEKDKQLAEHIVEISAGGRTADKEIKGEISVDFLKKYIAYAKSKCAPKLTEESAELLENFYVEDRKKSEENNSKKGNEIPVTVRQLEAIIRISESIAKMSLSTTVNKLHVEEAHRLFTISTLNAASAKREIPVILSDEERKEVLKIEESIRRKLSIGQSIQFSKLQDELNVRFPIPKLIVNAIMNMHKAGEIKFSDEKNLVTRKK